uniref:Uncharacterized protein n=1 Tax=Anguilla anguilla TaxID=7936 RepID=A0A0E9WEU7_ANGAN
MKNRRNTVAIFSSNYKLLPFFCLKVVFTYHFKCVPTHIIISKYIRVYTKRTAVMVLVTTY